MNQQEFLNLLKKYEEAYYSGESLVSDEEYDALKERYIEEYGEYEHVPNEGETGFKRVKHIHPLLSLDKVQLSDETELRKRLTKLWPVVIQPKFDGLSIEIQPDMKFITRGNGEEGDDVTVQCMQIQDIDIIESAFNNNTGPLRAEIIMTHSAFNELNIEREAQDLIPFSNCRNAASGMLRNLDLDKVKGLTVMIYEELGSAKNQSDIIDSLKAYIGEDALEMSKDYIRITPVYKPTDIDTAIEHLKRLEDYRKLIDYDIDGWVIKSDIENSLEVHGGYTGHHPKNAFAVKGEAKGAWTKINSITWQVGKENITPVAELEPVTIEGSTISRATLHNVGFLKAIGLDNIIINGGRTLVKVVKANDVIPKIIKVKKEYDFELAAVDNIQAPTKCPICGGETAIKESNSDSEILQCLNPECNAKLQARIEQMVSREAFDINGLSEKTIEKILKTFDVENPAEILNISTDEILMLEGYADKSAKQLYDAIQKAIKTQTLDKVIYASSIPLIGKDTAKLIANKYKAKELGNILSKPETEAIKDLCKIKGIGKETAKSFVKNKKLYESISAAILEVVDIAILESNKEQKSFCITGQREPFKTIIEEAGHKITGSVSKKTIALIAADGDLTTSKAIKAQELNIPIISTEKELRELI